MHKFTIVTPTALNGCLYGYYIIHKRDRFVSGRPIIFLTVQFDVIKKVRTANPVAKTKLIQMRA